MTIKLKWYQILRITVPVIYTVTIAAGLLGRNMVIMLTIMITTLLAGPFFCGWLCPFGALQDWMGRLGSILKIPRIQIPAEIEKWLKYLRYLLMVLSFTGLGMILFLTSPYETFLGTLSGYTDEITVGTWILLASLALLSMLTDRPFCRFLCPEGARYGIASLARIFGIRRNEKTCIGCGACDRKCPSGIKVSLKRTVRDPGCINCFECIAACPVEGAVEYGLIIRKAGKRSEEQP